jgi:nitroimidazol reductase NimA-like FMN-containing flavoprotein (pyridoxamine 5'-phosphate oxidase superfamily)
MNNIILNLMRRNEREIPGLQEINEIIRKADVCRVALANGDIPYIVTLSFGYEAGDGGKLYFHCANQGRKLEMIKKNNYVCFQIDTDHQLFNGEDGCDWGMKYSSVVGYGFVSIVTKPETRKAGLNCIMSHYGGEKEYTFDDKVLARTTILSLEIKEMTGKKC